MTGQFPVSDYEKLNLRNVVALVATVQFASDSIYTAADCAMQLQTWSDVLQRWRLVSVRSHLFVQWPHILQ